MFDIRKHVDLDSKGRAVCPACHLSKGTGHTKKNLSVDLDSGAYHCHRGCTKEEIRAVLGQERDRIVPTAWASPPEKAQCLTPQKVSEAHQRLLTSKEPLQWLLNRGIPIEAVKHYKLGECRAKVGGKDGKYFQSIGIPIRADIEGLKFYQKKRVAPWLPESEQPDGYKPWSQYGIPATVYFTHKPESATETYLCEGEWDAIRLGWEMRNTTEVAIACFTCGCGNIPTNDELDRLPGRVTIFYDLDEPGEKGAGKLRDKLRDRASIATVPHPDTHTKGWDITDALNHGFTVGDISEAAAAAKPWTEPKKENPLRDRILTNDELLDRAQDYTEWLVPDILTADELFVLGMPPRGGKSLFCLTLAKAVATGGTFLDRPVTQGSVIYVNLEDSETKIKQRQVAQGWSQGLPVYWIDKFKLSELSYLKQIADDYPDLRLLVLDTLSRIRDDGQEESSSKLGAILEPLQEFAKERGICILISHHMGKQSPDKASLDPFDLLRGSSAIRQTARGAIVIIAAEQSYRLVAENGFSDRLDINVRLNPETLEWKLLGNWQPRIDGDMKTQILDHLNLVGQATVAEIATQLNFNATSVSTIMSRLHRDGCVSKRGGGGTKPSLYTRSSNLLKQLEAQFEHPNADTEADAALLKQEKISENISAKVINEGESDHLNDHFPKNASRDTYLFEQSQDLSPASDSSSNSKMASLSKFEPGDTQNTENPVTGDTKKPGAFEWVYWAKADTVVQVISTRGEWATVRLPGKRQTDKVLISELGRK